MCQGVGSFAKAKGVEELAVGGLVVVLQVREQPPAAADHFQESLAGIEIFFMALEMTGELVDTLRQEDDLDLGGTGVGLMKTELL